MKQNHNADGQATRSFYEERNYAGSRPTIKGYEGIFGGNLNQGLVDRMLPAVDATLENGKHRVGIRQAAELAMTELYAAEAKHQHRLSPDMLRAIAILGEEYGELVKEVVDYTRANGELNTPENHLAILAEACQLAAITLAFIENLQEGRFTCQQK